jgi:hypothetical protein
MLLIMPKTLYHEPEPDQFAFEPNLWCVMSLRIVGEARGFGGTKETS